MAAKKFKTNGDTGVSIYIPGRGGPIRVEPDQPFETDDKAEIDALKNSSHVSEVKDTKK